jgi:hypothetical protein
VVLRELQFFVTICLMMIDSKFHLPRLKFFSHEQFNPNSHNSHEQVTLDLPFFKAKSIFLNKLRPEIYLASFLLRRCLFKKIILL